MDEKPMNGKTRPLTALPKTPEELLETGLLNLWYLVARVEDVADRPVALKRLDRNLVLWRGEQGELKVIEDYCPHRGAPLSMGEIAGGDLVCPYHGIQLDGRGVVKDVPFAPGCSLVGERAVHAYPCRELAGGIWVYFGDDAHGEPPEPVLPEEMASPEWTGFLYTSVWRCNWQLSLDNRTDPMHGTFLHTGTFTLGRGKKETELQVKPTPDGFETSRLNQRGVNIDWHEVFFRPESSFWIRTEIPYPESFGGGSFRIVGLPTPIDRDTTYFWVYRARKLAGWQRDMWRFMYQNRLGPRSNFVADQDRVVLEKIPLEARQREKLQQPDIALVRMRRMLRAEAARQLEGNNVGVRENAPVG
jgi:phenylpropionate dioxygenase-like ring-hydroxylating dioxygenase large terminal subunit